MATRHVAGLAVCIALTLAWAGVAAADDNGEDLVRNPGFEQSPSADDSGVGKLPAGWTISSHPKDKTASAKDCKSTFVKAEGGAEQTAHAGALSLDADDDWTYACVHVTLDEPLAVGDTIEFSVKLKASEKAKIDLYIEAWNRETNKGSTARKRFEITTAWTEYELELKVGKEAEGVKHFRALAQLYTPGATLFIDDAELELERKGLDDDDDDD